MVDDDETLRRGIVLALRKVWTVVEEAATGDAAIQCIRHRSALPFDVVVTDLQLAGADGVAVLRAAREREPRTCVVVMTAYGSVENAVDVMKAGAFDIVQKPLDLDQLEMRVGRAVEHRQLLGEAGELRAERAVRPVRPAGETIIGDSSGMRAAVDLARRVAPTRSTVLITGETGVGKELIAGLIHDTSPRAAGPLVKVNCAALPETLLESELFGHVRGAFTGADRDRVGRFEQASGGTLFLDEVGDMSATTQAKLLRVLQDQEFHRLGGTRILRTDTRILSATNQDLEESLRQGRFREDLFFRLNVIRIHIPPLRERPEDLIALAHHILGRISIAQGGPPRSFSESALERIRSHSWPGNVRELQNAIERAALMAEGPRVRSRDFSLLAVHSRADSNGWCPELPPDGVSLGKVERHLVLEALRRTGYVQKEAAGLLDISPRKLNYMIRRMGITHTAWRRNRAPGSGEGRAA